MVNCDSPAARGVLALRHVVINDKCDENVASDIVVSAMAENPSYIGIGGMGCLAVYPNRGGESTWTVPSSCSPHRDCDILADLD